MFRLIDLVFRPVQPHLKLLTEIMAQVYVLNLAQSATNMAIPIINIGSV